MTNLYNLKSIKTSKLSKRVGRGSGSGKGKTSARGHKGYKARSGSSARIKFEGGQNPLIARIPKLKGFKNLNTIVYKILNVKDLASLAEDGKITKKSLIEKDVLKEKELLKILGDGEIQKAIEIEADAASGSAKEKVEKAGGRIIVEK